MDLRTITKEELAALLNEAKKAHTEYEKVLGDKDDDWATWYADFILKKLQKASKLSTNPLPSIEADELPAKSPGGTVQLEAQPTSASEAEAKNGSSKDAEKPAAPASTAAPPAPIGEGTACPTCAHVNRPGILFCENCGTNLTTGQQTSVGTRDLRDPEASEGNGESKQLNTAALKLDASESRAVRSAGSNRFESNMTLRIEIEGGANPIILKPKSHDMILGRRDPTTGATPEVDLTPYAGYRMGVSRKHASLRLEENQLNLWDLGSSNGTFINGTRLNPHRPYPLRDGDEIRLGQMVLRLFFQSGNGPS